MVQIKIELPKDIWKVAVFGAGLLWLIHTIATMSYVAGRSDCQEPWDFPASLCWMPWAITCLWIGIFLISLRGWVKLAIALWLATVSLWGFLWLGTIG